MERSKTKLWSSFFVLQIIVVGCYSLKCDLSRLPCKNGQKCIGYNWICDQYKDCYDNSDEDGCQYQNREEFVKNLGLKYDVELEIFKCTKKGFFYTGNIKYCKDIDECENSTKNACEQRCSNQLGSYSCFCENGYVLAPDGLHCEDIDECKNSRINTCHHRCTNELGSFSCSCDRGYYLDEKDLRCKDIDECAQSICDHKCRNKVGSYKCSCNEGYTLATDGIKCLDDDECKDSPCQHHCDNSVGTYKCSCDKGYLLEEDGIHCKDIDECKDRKLNRCEHDCTNTEGSFVCTCPLGYQLEENGFHCEDIDECEDKSKNDCHQICTNTISSYTCSCKPGFTLSDEGYRCQDIDECLTNPCKGTCKNSKGSFQCFCPEGYAVEDFTECVDIDECESNPCEHNCENTLGEYLCSCNDGYELGWNGRSCEDINECKDSTLNECDQECNNEAGSYTCECNSGYLLVDEFQCEDINECLEFPRRCSHICDNTEGAYACSCQKGFWLTTDDSTCIIKEGHAKLIYSSKRNDVILKILNLDHRFNIITNRSGIIQNIFYHADKDTILWLETYPTGGYVLQKNLKDAKVNVLVQISVGSPETMAIDELNQEVYVADSALSTVVVFNLVTYDSKLLPHLTVDLPTSIAVHSTRGVIYYANIGQRHPGIFEATLSGSTNIEILQDDVVEPKALTLDPSLNVLYFADSALNKIEMVDLNDFRRVILLSSDTLMSPNGLTSLNIFEDNIYWCVNNSIYFANKRNPTSTKWVETNEAEISHILIGGSVVSFDAGKYMVATSPKVTTTVWPPITTETPPVTTETPPSTTETPPITTETPPITTETPPSTN